MYYHNHEVTLFVICVFECICVLFLLFLYPCILAFFGWLKTIVILYEYRACHVDNLQLIYNRSFTAIYLISFYFAMYILLLVVLSFICVRKRFNFVERFTIVKIHKFIIPCAIVLILLLFLPMEIYLKKTLNAFGTHIHTQDIATDRTQKNAT